MTLSTCSVNATKLIFNPLYEILPKFQRICGIASVIEAVELEIQELSDFFSGESTFFDKYIKNITQTIAQSCGSKDALIIDGLPPFWFAETLQMAELAKTHSIERLIIPPHAKITSLPPITKLYDTIYINAHGNPNRVLLGNRFLEKGSINTIQILCNAMKSGAELIFNSCSVGEGDDNLAKKISELCPKITVYASETLHHPLQAYERDAANIPIFKTNLGFDATKIYKKGFSQENPRLALFFVPALKRLELAIQYWGSWLYFHLFNPPRPDFQTCP